VIGVPNNFIDLDLSEADIVISSLKEVTLEMLEELVKTA